MSPPHSFHAGVDRHAARPGFAPVWMSQRPCAVCGTQLTVHQAVRSGLCDRASCHRTMLMERERERRRALREAVTQAARAASARVAPQRGVDADGLAVVVLPANPWRLAPLSTRRRRAFQAHLSEQIAKANRSAGGATARRAAAVPLDPPPAAVVAACATCRGRCCGRGADHAFVDVETIRRYMRRTRVTAARAIAAAFLRHLPPVSYQASCVYHTRSGCNLPRDMRGAICNTFFCGDLREHWAALDSVRAPTLLAAAEDGRLAHLAVIDERSEPRFLPVPRQRKRRAPSA